MAAGIETVALELAWDVHDGLVPGTYQSAGLITALTPPSAQSDEAEASHFSSPNNLKKFLPGMIDPGDATFTAHWDPGSDEDVMLRALAGSRAIRNHRITFPTSGGGTYLWTFPAWIKGIGTETALGQTMSFQVTMRITGVPTMAAGA